MHAPAASVNTALNPWDRRWWRRTWGAIVNFDPKVDLGQLAVILTLASGGFYWAVTSHDTASQAKDAVNALRGDVAALRTDTNDQFKQVRADIANLPDVRAQLVQMEKRLDANDSRVDAQSKRMELLEREVIQSRADLDNVIRSSQTPAKH